MPITDLEPSDDKMVGRWQMFTEFMLNHLPPGEVKKMVDEIHDSINYQVNEEGNIESVELSPIDRDKEHLTDRFQRKINKVDTAEDVVRRKLEEMPEDASEYKELGAKEEALQEVLEEIDNA